MKVFLVNMGEIIFIPSNSGTCMVLSILTLILSLPLLYISTHEFPIYSKLDPPMNDNINISSSFISDSILINPLIPNTKSVQMYQFIIMPHVVLQKSNMYWCSNNTSIYKCNVWHKLDS